MPGIQHNKQHIQDTKSKKCMRISMPSSKRAQESDTLPWYPTWPMLLKPLERWLWPKNTSLSHHTVRPGEQNPYGKITASDASMRISIPREVL